MITNIVLLSYLDLNYFVAMKKNDYPTFFRSFANHMSSDENGWKNNFKKFAEEEANFLLNPIKGVQDIKNMQLHFDRLLSLTDPAYSTKAHIR